MSIHQVFSFLYRSALPSYKDLRAMPNLCQIIDLTNRDRNVKKYCDQLNIIYYKCPLNEHLIDESKINEILTLIDPSTTTLIHCWGGKHRTGLIVALIQHRHHVPRSIILTDLFRYGFGDPLKHPKYFEYLIDKIC